MSRHAASIRFTSAGFTLLELLVVLVIAAIAATVVGGGAQSYMERARYHQVVRDVATQLNQARALCVQEGRQVVVVYRPEMRQVVVDGRSQIEIPERLQVQWESSERRPADMSMAGEPIFVFNADGGARGGRLTVLRGQQGVVFRVNWLLGTIEQAAVAGKP